MNFLKKYNKAILLLTIVCFFQLHQSSAQSYNSPFFYKAQNFDVIYREFNEDKLEFPLSDVDQTTITGRKTYIQYQFKSDNVALKPQPEQLLRVYFANIARHGVKKVYQGFQYGSYKLNSGGKEYWAIVEVYNNGESYCVAVIENDDPKSNINASELLNSLNRDGKIALYINFEKGKAALSKESYGNIEEIVKLLQENPFLKLNIEGHTDNTGTPVQNKLLSEKRAEAVKEAIVKQGINPDRLNAIGWGQEKPIAENSSEEGMRKNRRVELVKAK